MITLTRYVAAVDPPVTAAPAARHRSRRPGEALTLFSLSAALYLVVAYEMVHRRIIFADAVSRVANGYFVSFSRDAHLPAVGFVWNPLPSILDLPLLAFRGLYAPLARDGFAGNIESALFMAGAVALVASCLNKLQVRRVPRLLLTAVFALHPMIVTYAGSGESEAMLLFFCLLSVTALIDWLNARRPGQLVMVGIALGLAYMTRYEAIAPSVAVAVLVGLLSYFGASGSRALRRRMAANDVALVGLPFMFAFALWAVSSKILVGGWFPTFSSRYGNSAQVGLSRQFIEQATGTGSGAALRYALDQLTGLEPLLLPLLVLAAVVATRRRVWAGLAAPVVLGAVLGFDNAAFLTGSSFGWLRFQIAVIPLAVLLAGTAMARPAPAPASMATESDLPATPSQSQHPGRGARWVRPVLMVVVVLLAASGLPAAAVTLTNHRLAREETATMLAAVMPSLADDQDRRHLKIFQTERAVADYLDALHLPTGAVVTDSAFAFPVLLATRRPKQFVITSDRDFKTVLASPRAHHARYLLVPEPAKAPSDALEHAWPKLYEDGAGIARLVTEWQGTSFNGNWRLYELK